MAFLYAFSLIPDALARCSVSSFVIVPRVTLRNASSLSSCTFCIWNFTASSLSMRFKLMEPAYCLSSSPCSPMPILSDISCTVSPSTLTLSDRTAAPAMVVAELSYICLRNGSTSGPRSRIISFDHLAKSLAPVSMWCPPIITKSFSCSGSRNGFAPNLNNLALVLSMAPLRSKNRSKNPSPLFGLSAKSAAVRVGKKLKSSGPTGASAGATPLPPRVGSGLLIGTDPWNPSPKSLVITPLDTLTVEPSGTITGWSLPSLAISSAVMFGPAPSTWDVALRPISATSAPSSEKNLPKDGCISVK